MLITGNQITDQNLLANDEANNIRGGSYYLRIHSIIPAGEEAKSYDPSQPKKFHTLEPGGLAWVISEEKFQIEDTSVTALVTLRSGFTKQGMLALDVGLVDANFHGPIGSLVINFSKKPIRLDAGDQFFRVLFFEHAEATGTQIPQRIDHDHVTYAKKIISDMVGDFSGTFLQTAEMEERIEDKLRSGLVEKLEPNILDSLASHFLRNHWGKLLFAVLLALGVGSAFGVGKYFHTEEQIKEMIEDYQAELKENEN